MKISIVEWLVSKDPAKLVCCTVKAAPYRKCDCSWRVQPMVTYGCVRPLKQIVVLIVLDC
jgi:hypothetical protein